MKDSLTRRTLGEMARAFTTSPRTSEGMISRKAIRILKVVYGLITMLLAALGMATLWSEPFLLTGILIALALAKHIAFPIKYEWYWFISIGLLGALLEALIINGGAWSYVHPQLFNIPLWLPAIWGLTAMVLVTGYSGAAGEM